MPAGVRGAVQRRDPRAQGHQGDRSASGSASRASHQEPLYVECALTSGCMWIQDTVHWGYFSKTLPHKLSIKSGDEVTVEMVSHHCGDDPDLMSKGDKNLEEIYAWGPKGLSHHAASCILMWPAAS